MRAVVIRTSGASLTADGQPRGQIAQGLVVLVGVTHSDGPEQAA